MADFTAGRLAELVAALRLLTRIGLPWVGSAEVPIASHIWAFPLVGVLIGGLGALGFAVCSMLGMPPAMGAVWTLAAMALLTGAFHEDGLADTADGFGGGRTRERKLDIMRDSRIGSFGAIALILSLGARGIAIAALGEPARVMVALTVAAALGRAAMLVLVMALNPARPDGLAAGLRKSATSRIVVGLATAGVVAALLLPAGVAVRAILGGLFAALAVAWIARRQVGGYTGDVLGASSVVAECVVLSLLAGALGTS